VSLDAPAYADEEAPLHTVFCADQEGIDESYEKEQMRQMVQACLGVLSEREHQILRYYFGLDDTQPKTSRDRRRDGHNARARPPVAQPRPGQGAHPVGSLLVDFSDN